MTEEHGLLRRHERIMSDGTPWAISTWATTTPKLLHDGERVYAVGLLDSPDGQERIGRLYWRDDGGWHAGAGVPVYQPATLILDSEGHINAFANDCGQRGHHWRSDRPGDVTSFHQVHLTGAERFSSYLAAGREGDTMVLAGLDATYTMWIATKAAPDAPWTEPQLLAPGDKTRPDAVADAVLRSRHAGDEAVHVAYSNCPDGSVHNTYDRVEYALFDTAAGRVARHDVIIQGPPGEITLAVDALRTDDGTVHVAYIAGLHAYGQPRPDLRERAGVYVATLHPGGQWKVAKVTPPESPGVPYFLESGEGAGYIRGFSQLVSTSDGALHLIEQTPDGILHSRSADGGATWQPHGGEWAHRWEPGKGQGNLYAVKRNSGSAVDDTARVLAGTWPNGWLPAGQPGRPSHALEYFELSLVRR